ncbi:hypothetical protein B0O99DRAFT_123755 [Bisporella sp. PMI_857]|nr:hypothetical protein B0O99DRAFT_123755 [Bisporella sp. PMI_857]
MTYVWLFVDFDFPSDNTRKLLLVLFIYIYIYIFGEALLFASENSRFFAVISLSIFVASIHHALLHVRSSNLLPRASCLRCAGAWAGYH